MPVEMAPLLGKTQPRQVNGVALFDLERAVVAVGGIGERCARRAAETAIDDAEPKLLVSAGIAGAISPRLKVGDVLQIREVVDVATGVQYPSCGDEGVLATSQDVSDAVEKRQLLAKYGADVVDMEGAAVAQIAKERGLAFEAVKAISDDASFKMPPLMRFIDEQGRFHNGQFLLYVALRPRWWPALGRIRANTALATANLCRAVENLIEMTGTTCR